MFVQKSNSDLKKTSPNYESKYTCFVCLERVKYPITCIRCKKFICKSHVKSIHNRCPYCRLQPFEYIEDVFLCQLVEYDRKKQQQFMIQNSVFKCLVEGCDFEGRYHKMDLHRRKCHRNETLKEIIFADERQNARKLKALEMLMKRIQEKQQQISTHKHLATVIHGRTGGRVSINQIYRMITHVEQCKHPNCTKIFAEQTMCFIGNELKQISECPRAQQFLVFYDHL